MGHQDVRSAWSVTPGPAPSNGRSQTALLLADHVGVARQEVRGKKRPSRVAGALVFLGLVVGFSIIQVLLFGTPAPPKDLAVLTAIMMVVISIWLGAVLVWDRIMRKRRRNRLGG